MNRGHLLEAQRLLTRIPLIDAHADFAWRHVEEDADIVSGRNCRQISLALWEKAHVRVQGAALYTPPSYAGAAATAFADEMIDYVEAAIRRAPDRLRPVRDAAELEALALEDPAARAVGLVLWIEGVSPFAGSLEVAGRFVGRGVRGVGLTHNGSNEAGDGCFVGRPKGLTAFGHDLIDWLHDRRIVVDLAHLSRPAFWDAIRHRQRPVVVSHTGLEIKVATPRNLDDEQVRAVADTGGVVGIDFYPGHVGTISAKGVVRADVADVADCIDHVVALVGDDHVALGSDYDGYETDCAGLESVDRMPNLVGELLARGYHEDRLAKVLFGNWRRVLHDVWGTPPTSGPA